MGQKEGAAERKNEAATQPQHNDSSGTGTLLSWLLCAKCLSHEEQTTPTRLNLQRRVAEKQSKMKDDSDIVDPPSPTTVIRWRNSAGNAVEDCLKGKCKGSFLAFCDSVGSGAFVRCWTEMERYREEPIQQQRKAIVAEVIRRFMSPRSKELVGFEGGVMRSVKNGSDGADPNLMDEATRWLLNELDKDFQKFLDNCSKAAKK